MDTITGSHVINTVDSSPPVQRQRLGRAVTQWSVTKAEWIKLRSVRVNVLGVAAAAVALVMLGALFSAFGNTDQGPRGNVADSVSLVFGGITLSQLIIGVLAALFVGGEYASGLIRTTFGAVGRRTRVLRAKAIVFGGAAWLAMTIGAFGAFFAGTAVYGGDLTSYSIDDPGVLRAVLSAGFYGACVALIGIAVGFLLRSTAAAIGVLIGVLMLAPVLVGLLPGTIGDTFTKILPSRAGDAMMSVTSPDDLLSPWFAFAVLVAWVVGLLAIAGVTLRRRDA
jgi:ABC-2 type transport system permease protein